MRAKTKEMMSRIEKLLEDGIPQPTNAIAKRVRLQPRSIYKMVRMLRERGVGIIPTKKGYLLSKHAEKRDDVLFLRKLNGRRTSDVIALAAARYDIAKRWSSAIEKKDLLLVVNPLLPSLGVLQEGRSVLLRESARLGV